ncbi:MAG: hypothetical protein WD749_11015 [Phycisphaerales bacterium]
MRPNGSGSIWLVMAAAAALTAAPGCGLIRVPGEAAPLRQVRGPGDDPPPVGPPRRSDTATVGLPPAAVYSPGEPLDVVAIPGAPETSAASPAAGAPILIDQKVGEINGRPIRTREVLDEVGDRLAKAAAERLLTLEEWKVVRNRADLDPRIAGSRVSRDDWMRFAAWQIALALNKVLEDELLEAEARASLKERERQGLRYILQEAQGDLRRQSGGSRAAAERRLGKTEQQFLRERESTILIQHQLMERVYSRARVSWKDVRLYYERNFELYNPPPAARFRLIRVPASRTEAVAKVREALDAGEPFERVAALPENAHNAATGGLLADLRPFTGEYAQADLRLPQVIQAAAQTLQEKQFTRVPVDHAGDKVWVYLDEIIRRARPLAHRDVQLDIARILISTARNQELRNYINQLKRRASFSDMDVMILTILQAAAERYWPEGVR